MKLTNGNDTVEIKEGQEVRVSLNVGEQRAFIITVNEYRTIESTRRNGTFYSVVDGEEIEFAGDLPIWMTGLIPADCTGGWVHITTTGRALIDARDWYCDLDGWQRHEVSEASYHNSHEL